MTNIQAALGVAQLEQVDAFVAAKLAIASRYDTALSGLPGVSLPPRPPWARPTMWLYSLLIDPAEGSTDRREALEVLDRHGIQARPVWAPAHHMAFYRDAPRLGGAVGEQLFDRGLSLPCTVSLSEEQQEKVIDVLGAATRGAPL